MSTSSSSQINNGDRSPWGIAWSCLAVIIACAWKAVHLDVPNQETKSRQWWRRTRMTFWTIFVPEFVIRRAAIQWFRARQISQKAPRDIESKAEADRKLDTEPPNNWVKNLFFRGKAPTKRRWSRVHSFFLVMGGFAVSTPDKSNRIVPVDHNRISFANADSWPDVDVVEINDKSNGDTFTKTFVVWQTTWFVIELVTRLVQGLAITQLEIMTLAYALSCALLYWLWWNKPYDVQTPIVVSFTQTSPPNLPASPPDTPLFQYILSKDWIVTLDRIMFGGVDDDFSGEDYRTKIRVFLFASATFFGCIHCIPWNFQFPTILERIMWIVSASIIAGAPLIMGVMLVVIERRENPPRAITMMVLHFIHLILAFTYCLARFILIIQAFVLLRNLSPSAVQSISWSRLMPHV